MARLMRKDLASVRALWSIVRRPQDTALPEGNRSGGRRQKGHASCRGAVVSVPRHPVVPATAHWPNAQNSGGLGAGPQGRVLTLRNGHALALGGLCRLLPLAGCGVAAAAFC